MNNTLTEKDFERGRKLDKSKLAINYDALFSSNMSEVDDFKEPVLNTNIGNLVSVYSLIVITIMSEKKILIKWTLIIKVVTFKKH